jgi:hypothetical protein
MSYSLAALASAHRSRCGDFAVSTSKEELMAITLPAFLDGRNQLTELVGHLELSKDNLQPEVLEHAMQAHVLLSTYLHQPPPQTVLQEARVHLKVVRRHLVNVYDEGSVPLELCDGALQNLSA